MLKLYSIVFIFTLVFMTCGGNKKIDVTSAHDHAHDVNRCAAIIQPRRDLGEILPRQIRDGIEHVCAGIEHESAAGDHRVLPPCGHREPTPVLPDCRADAEEFADFAGLDHVYRRANLR